MRKKNEMLMQFPAVRDQFGSSVRFNLLIGAGTQLSQNIRKLFSRWILSVKHTRSVSAERVKFQSKYEKKNERCKKKAAAVLLKKPSAFDSCCLCHRSWHDFARKKLIL